jgi:hypothetical protein
MDGGHCCVWADDEGRSVPVIFEIGRRAWLVCFACSHFLLVPLNHYHCFRKIALLRFTYKCLAVTCQHVQSDVE